jgi:hypothetical protein
VTEPDDLSSAGEDTPGEDDGVLSFSDSLLSDDLDADVLDTGVDAGSGYRGATAYGTTAAEEARGESLADHLAEEEPDQQPDLPWTDEDEPTDDGNVALPRSGRLVAARPGRARRRRGRPRRVRRGRRRWRRQRRGGRRPPHQTTRLHVRRSR